MLLVLASLSFASACASGPADSYCAVAVPIFVDAADVLTTETVRQIVAHNETWERLCR